jgi:threonine/homoserine efflux transporter RhtA
LKWQQETARLVSWLRPHRRRALTPKKMKVIFIVVAALASEYCFSEAEQNIPFGIMKEKNKEKKT